jgi:protein O-mannosyl-transferase
MNSPVAAAPHRFSITLSAMLIVATAFVVYGNSFSVPFLLDDVTTITGNSSIRQLWPLSSVLFPPPEVYSAGRPLLNLSFALNYAIGGTAVGGYHIVNALIHALAGLVLFGLARRTLALPALGAAVRQAAMPLAFLVAVVWVAHPAQTASVTYISQRAESLMGLFYLLTLYGFVRATAEASPLWFGITVLACACGMATKEVMATAPLLALLYDRQFVSGSFRNAWQRHRRIYFALAATWLVLVALMLASQIGTRGIGVGHNLSRFEYLRIESRAITHYLRICLWPDPLIFDFGPQLAVPSGWDLAWRALLIVAMIVTSVAAFWRLRVSGFLGIAFFVLLAPSSSVVPIAGQPIAENRVYLPLAAIAALVIVGGYRWLGKKSLVLAVAALLSLAWAAHQRNKAFRSEIGIWDDTVLKHPDNVRAWVLLSAAQFGRGQIDAAVATMLNALRQRPATAEFHNNVGVYYYHARNLAEAVRHLREAIRLNPTYNSAYSALGQTLVETNDWTGAASAFEALTRLEPTNAEAQNFLGVALSRLGRIGEAIERVEIALKLRPDFPDARNNLAILRGEKR